MSNFTSRLNGIGGFSIGDAIFTVLEVKGSWMRVVQTHSSIDGSLLPWFALSFDASGETQGAGTSVTACPTGFWVPQSHAALNTIKAQIADLDNQVLEPCATCAAAGVTSEDMTGACASCTSNANTIAYLKTV